MSTPPAAASPSRSPSEFASELSSKSRWTSADIGLCEHEPSKAFKSGRPLRIARAQQKLPSPLSCVRVMVQLVLRMQANAVNIARLSRAIKLATKVCLGRLASF